MPIQSIISQPTINQLTAAYRPIVFRVSATATNGQPKPPVIYCDIYFGGIFYKTLSKTQASSTNSVWTEWEFDIQDAAQEYLKKYIAANGFTMIAQVSQAITLCFCRFRSSGINTDGFTEGEGTAPIQRTGSTDPVPGTGTDTNTFFILNSALQHEDNQDLAAHLTSFKKRTWTADAFPLTHRPDNYKVTPNDSDFFPIVYVGNDLPASIVLNYRFRGQATWRTAANFQVIACPNLSNLQIGLINNGTGTQTITFTFDALPAMLSSLGIAYRPQGSPGAFTNVAGSSITSPRTVTLPLGLYEFRFTTLGPCVSSPVSIQNVGVPNTPCTPVSIVGSPSLPDGRTGQPYSYTINLAGTSPFALTNIIKPSWLTMTVSGSTIVFSGIPDASGTGIQVSFTATNCYTSETTDYFDSIDVTEQTNSILIVVQPGSMDIGFTPASCWRWTGTVNIRDSVGNLVATQTWNSHTDPSQQEELDAMDLPNDDYTIDWILSCVQNCVAVVTSVDFIEDFGGAINLTGTDNATVSVSGSTTKQIQLNVNNG